MSTYTVWDAAKDCAGALGSILVVVPWFRDFDWRRRSASFKTAKFEGPAGISFGARISALYKERIDTPKAGDLVLSIVGVLLICASYVIALVEGVAGW